MKSIKAKIKSNKLLLKASQTNLDQASSQLSKVRDHKLAKLKDLKHHQKSYIEGVESLNKERLSKNRSQLDALERGVDHSKSQWYQCLKMVKDIEKQEKQCLENLLVAERKHKTFEKMQDQYLKELKLEMKLSEQRELDELALQQFVRKD